MAQIILAEKSIKICLDLKKNPNIINRHPLMIVRDPPQHQPFPCKFTVSGFCITVIRSIVQLWITWSARTSRMHILEKGAFILRSNFLRATAVRHTENLGFCTLDNKKELKRRNRASSLRLPVQTSRSQHRHHPSNRKGQMSTASKNEQTISKDHNDGEKLFSVKLNIRGRVQGVFYR